MKLASQQKVITENQINKPVLSKTTSTTSVKRASHASRETLKKKDKQALKEEIMLECSSQKKAKLTITERKSTDDKNPMIQRTRKDTLVETTNFRLFDFLQIPQIRI